MTGLISRGKALLAITLSATLIAFAAPAMAQEVPPEQLALARKYVDLTDRAAVFETTMVEIAIGSMRQIVHQYGYRKNSRRIQDPQERAARPVRARLRCPLHDSRTSGDRRFLRKPDWPEAFRG
jgi:hypothetical protein